MRITDMTGPRRYITTLDATTTALSRTIQALCMRTEFTHLPRAVTQSLEAGVEAQDTRNMVVKLAIQMLIRPTLIASLQIHRSTNMSLLPSPKHLERCSCEGS